MEKKKERKRIWVVKAAVVLLVVLALCTAASRTVWNLLLAGRFRAYVQVVLPNMFSGILVSALLAESVVFGDFVLANNIAGNNYQNIQVFLNRRMFTSSGLASAIVVVIFLVVFIVTGLVLKLQKNESKEK